MRLLRVARPILGLAAALVLLIVVGLVAVEVGVPVGGISRDQATKQAGREVPSTIPPQVRWAIPGPFGLFRGGATDAVSPGYRLVWAITFSGTYEPGSCGPAPPPGTAAHCPPPDHTATVMLDYFSGAFIMATLSP